MARKPKEKKPSPLTVALNSYLDAGCIVAGASGLSLWAAEFGLNSFSSGAVRSTPCYFCNEFPYVTSRIRYIGNWSWNWDPFKLDLSF